MLSETFFLLLPLACSEDVDFVFFVAMEDRTVVALHPDDRRRGDLVHLQGLYNELIFLDLTHLYS